MGVKLIKIAQDKWNVQADGNIVGTCEKSYANYHGCYEVKLNNGIIIRTFTQKSVKEMVGENI